MLPCPEVIMPMVPPGEYEILQGLDEAHRTLGIGYHNPHEFIGGNVCDRFLSVVLDTRTDGQEVELS
jgi:hypothetical protein